MSWRARLGPLYPFAVSLQFFTRLPMPRELNPGREDLAEAAAWVPLVGALLAALMALFGLLLGGLGVPIGLRAVAVVGLGVLLTGAFHEDGLADAADGLIGGLSREDKLRIMKDSRIGSYGTVALVLAFGARFAALQATPPAAWPAALLAAHLLGRASSLPLTLALPYAQSAGKAKPMLEATRPRALSSALALTVAACLLLGPPALVALGLAALVVWAAHRALRRLIGGITGDALGGVNVLVEVLALAVYASWGGAG